MDLRVVKLIKDTHDALKLLDTHEGAHSWSTVYSHLKALEEIDCNQPALLEDNAQDVMDAGFLTRLVALAERPLTHEKQDTLKLARRVHDSMIRLLIRVERALMRCGGRSSPVPKARSARK